MARGRIIAKTLSTSEKYASLHELAPKLAEFCQSLYPLLVAHADDFGRLQGDPFTVKHLVHPTSPRSLQDFRSSLSALHESRLIVWYEIEGRSYIQVNNFDEYQWGLKKRTRSSHPEPPGNSSGFQNPPDIPSEEKGREGKGTEEKGREQKGAATPQPADLLALWNETVTYLPKARELSKDRQEHARARLKEHPSLDDWRAVFSRMDSSPFCQGITAREGWRADFDFAIRRGTFGKVLEGKYDDRRKEPDRPPPPAQSGRVRGDNSDLSYLDEIA